MVDIIHYIRNLIFAPTPNRKRRAPIDESDIPVSSKIRRRDYYQDSNSLEDDWHSPGSLGNIKHRNSLNGPTMAAKPRSSWSKENITVVVDDDDDDDVLEITKPTHPIRKSSKLLNYTSTPNYSFKHPSINYQNGDDDVTILKSTQSLEEKQERAKKQGFKYIKPFSYINNNNTKTRGIQNGGTRPREITSPIFSSIRNIKSKLYQNRRSFLRSPSLEQSFRLDEKLKYKQLLAESAPNYGSLTDSFLKYNAPMGKLGVIDSNSRGKKLTEMCLKNNKPMCFIDLTTNDKPKKRLSVKETINKVLSEFENEPVAVKDSDSDVEILPAPPSPKPDIKVERINSMKKIVDTSELTRNEWLTNRIQRFNEVISTLEVDINNQIAHKQKLSEITSKIQAKRLEEQMMKCLQIEDAVLPEYFDTILPVLSEEDNLRIDNALNDCKSPNETLVQKFNLNIKRADILTLAGLNWLNDEVINFYMNLLIERGKIPKWPKTYAMNTFFYPKLHKSGASSLLRWTRRVDIFSYDLIAVPVHLGVHWCMSIIDFRDRSIKYYDSMDGSNKRCLEALRNYLQVEHLDKKKKTYDTSDWCLENVSNIPHQMNGSDCGMFACTFAEYLTRNAKINFSQADMPYLRRKMVLEILNGELCIQ